MTRYFLGIQNQKKKVDLSEVSQIHFLRKTIDLLPDIVKTRIVRSTKNTAPRGHFELLRSRIGSILAKLGRVE